ncbi:symmetrical bis(5'-nucleosyl)-tetraphosphatase [Colwellia sp. M166]|jgi:bis(5'-nucleosyl)-tetraphosphatase (symmetrical)|uniref:symmetrical bis(5'-nucleosyl)-tetraphosphatase n=1 Tax=Colwellia sp. M166 TaxID=2583805 RepID=UPI00211DB133|nr:symmetrical bis(5'-nucleosyl)-tetraphosphatase [Colwellia sp. M166]UUO24433.1 symmetrical bis(5'-nucleosyl)-tetraphosphatase [Colwellia sp. M166]|tara:strand:- start:33 stop:851 length:819 start_codon:yes stop_codon:yes gene_type:complete
MAIYFVGDIQGCYSELKALLTQVAFSRQNDQLYVAGDLVARGPNSLETLRFIKSLGKSAKVVLGNHDLHLLAVYYGIKKVKKQDKLSALLSAPDLTSLMTWLIQQPLIQKLPDEETYMSHAGLSPQWTPNQALLQAEIAQQHLRSSEAKHWLSQMYGEQPIDWQNADDDISRFRFTINSLTRMRYCYADGSLDFSCKESPSNAPKTLSPWFEFRHINENTQWVFGHWAALMGCCQPKNIYALDTGCVWGQHLTILRWHDKKLFTEQSHKKLR